MSVPGLVQIALFLVLILVLAKPLGIYMARVFGGERTPLSPILAPVERVLYRLAGVDAATEQRWTAYAAGMLLFNLAGILLTYLILRLQGVLPLNPQGLSELTPDLAFNTAVSFATNTNWQSYSGESTMSNFSQMIGLAVHNFTSAATGLAIAIALVRGLARRSADAIGNFWVDMTRAVLYILLPLSIVLALVFVSRGVPQTFDAFVGAKTVEGADQTIPLGPMASQEAIKQLGTNGGGFFNANSAHPFENPTPLTDFLAILAIFLIPAALVYTFGRMVGDPRQGWAILATMTILFAIGLAIALPVEQGGNPQIAALGVDQSLTANQPGGNFEGKEARFGIASSILFATVTTDASCGAVNAMHDSFMPLAGMVPLLNIQLGEIIFGGVGAGLYGILVFAILAVFIAGQMVGRTPEYLGKKIESFEMKMAMLTVLVLGASILVFTALASVLPQGIGGLNNAGPHGFSEMLYAFSSATGNNGSAFAGLTANVPFYNVTLGLAMLVGRFLMIVPILAIAGSMGRKRAIPPSLGTLPTYSPLWIGLLLGTIVIVGALTYFPALALGPIVGHLLLSAGNLF